MAAHARARATRRAAVIGLVAAAWGALGFALLLGYAILRLGGVVRDGLAAGSWQSLHWAALAASVGAMCYFEGYRAFQLAYAPRFAARAGRLLREPTWSGALLAPLYCMEFIHAPRARVLRAVVLTVAILLLVLAVRALPQPWRAIIDAGVVAGLAWGLAVTLLAVGRTVRNGGVPAGA